MGEEKQKQKIGRGDATVLFWETTIVWCTVLAVRRVPYLVPFWQQVLCIMQLLFLKTELLHYLSLFFASVSLLPFTMQDVFPPALTGWLLVLCCTATDWSCIRIDCCFSSFLLHLWLFIFFCCLHQDGNCSVRTQGGGSIKIPGGGKVRQRGEVEIPRGIVVMTLVWHTPVCIVIVRTLEEVQVKWPLHKLMVLFFCLTIHCISIFFCTGWLSILAFTRWCVHRSIVFLFIW